MSHLYFLTLIVLFHNPWWLRAKWLWASLLLGYFFEQITQVVSVFSECTFVLWLKRPHLSTNILSHKLHWTLFLLQCILGFLFWPKWTSSLCCSSVRCNLHILHVTNMNFFIVLFNFHDGVKLGRHNQCFETNLFFINGYPSRQDRIIELTMTKNRC